METIIFNSMLGYKAGDTVSVIDGYHLIKRAEGYYQVAGFDKQFKHLHLSVTQTVTTINQPKTL